MLLIMKVYIIFLRVQIRVSSLGYRHTLIHTTSFRHTLGHKGIAGIQTARIARSLPSMAVDTHSRRV